jgi:hypothetical protein
MSNQTEALRQLLDAHNNSATLLGALTQISLLTHPDGEVADYADVVEAVRRLHALNGELGAALRRLISYCNTLENRLMEADGEHPAVQEAKEAYAKVEGKV